MIDLLFAVFFSFANISGADAVAKLDQKNHFALLRHARAPGTGDPAGFKLGDCATQRNLSPEGLAQAKSIGKNLSSKLGQDFWVFTSEWCRCRDTAKLLGGKAPQELPLLNSFFQKSEIAGRQTEELKTWLKENLPKHRPLVLVTHQVNITELTGIFPSEGQIIVLKMGPDGKLIHVKEE